MMAVFGWGAKGTEVSKNGSKEGVTIRKGSGGDLERGQASRERGSPSDGQYTEQFREFTYRRQD